MKKYFSITYESVDNEHLNVQDLLPADCSIITGVAVSACVKDQVGQLQEITKPLSFPKHLIAGLLRKDNIVNFLYSYLRTRSTEEESRSYFEGFLLPEIVNTLCENIKYTCLDLDGQDELQQNITILFNNQFSEYLYDEIALFEQSKNLDNDSFRELIARQVLVFAYLRKRDIFLKRQNRYVTPEPFECGNISLLINGNSFLLRDYTLIANRQLRHLSKEIIPFHEPLEVNSSIHTVFKSNKKCNEKTLTIRIYIEYETTISDKVKKEIPR